jgi:hypothetical protein
MEDAREVIPLGAQHRISWKMNLQTLLHVVGKRGCWILQAGLWAPIIQGMIHELATKVHPGFRRIVQPPCIDNDLFGACEFVLENVRRMDGDDQHPPCPLYCTQVIGQDPRAKLPNGPYAYPIPMREQLLNRAETYRDLWDRDPYVWNQR